MNTAEKLRKALIHVGFDYVDCGGVGLKCNECGGESPRGFDSWMQWEKAVKHEPGCMVGDALSDTATEPMLYPLSGMLIPSREPRMSGPDFLGLMQWEIDRTTAECEQAVWNWYWRGK